MAQIDEIIDIILGKGELTIEEISNEMGMVESEISNTLREAEIEGLIFRTTIKNKEVFRV